MKKFVLINILALIFSININASNFSPARHISKEYNLEQINYNAIKTFFNEPKESIEKIYVNIHISTILNCMRLYISIKTKKDQYLDFYIESISFIKDKKNKIIMSTFKKDKKTIQVSVERDNIAIQTPNGIFINENNLFKMKDRDFSERKVRN